MRLPWLDDMPEGIDFFITVPDEEKLYPSASYQNAAMIVKLVLSRHPIDIQDPAHIREYYTALFTHQSYDHDAPKLVSAIEAHDFVEAERQYRFVPQAGVLCSQVDDQAVGGGKPGIIQGHAILPQGQAHGGKA